MRIAAVADIDFGGSMELFSKELQKAKEPDLLLLAGDMCDFGQYGQYKEILAKIRKAGWKCPIYACFGNKEFEQDHAKLKKRYPEIIFLDDEKSEFTAAGTKVGIVGSKGCLDAPTFWQSRNVIGIRDEYSRRLALLEKLMKSLKGEVKILLTHYAPTYRTLEGEDARIWKVLGTSKLEEPMEEAGITLAVHGHAHYGSPLGFVGRIPVFNVALPVNRKIVVVDTDRLPKPAKG
ncbi:MAG: metallophosphoesterase [Candidatus Aenigmatarchaeota archaeon]